MTYTQRILNFLSKNENATFNRSVARRIFRKEYSTQTPEQFDNSVMRAARKLSQQNMLRRVSHGEYALPVKSRKQSSR